MFNPYILLFSSYWVLSLSYSYATCKPYTRISSLHNKSLIGISEEWLQHHLVNPNSDSASGINSRLYYDPTRILPLVAIAKAPHLRFGVPPSTTIVSRLLPQRLSASIPASFDLTYLVRLSTLVQRIYTEFLFNSDRFSLAIPRGNTLSSTTTWRYLSWCHKTGL
jgi:hypothetical protein